MELHRRDCASLDLAGSASPRQTSRNYVIDHSARIIRPVATSLEPEFSDHVSSLIHVAFPMPRREIKGNPIKTGAYRELRFTTFGRLEAALSESTRGSARNCESSSSRSAVNTSRRNAPCRGPSRSTRYGLSLEKGHYARYPLGAFLCLAIIKSTAGRACRSRYE